MLPCSGFIRWLTVPGLVRQELLFHGVWCVTLAALEWLLASMQAPVHNEVSVCCELLVAELTSVLFTGRCYCFCSSCRCCCCSRRCSGSGRYRHWYRGCTCWWRYWLYYFGLGWRFLLLNRYKMTWKISEKYQNMTQRYFPVFFLEWLVSNFLHQNDKAVLRVYIFRISGIRIKLQDILDSEPALNILVLV